MTPSKNANTAWPAITAAKRLIELPYFQRFIKKMTDPQTTK